MGITSGLYKLLLLLHILAVIVGIGAVSLNGLYGRESRQKPGAEGRAVFEANWFVSSVAGYVIYMIPVFGIALVLASDSVYSMGDAWISLSVVLYVAALGIVHGVMRPNLRKMLSLMKEMEAWGPPNVMEAWGPPNVMEAGPPAAGGPPPQVAEMERRGRTVGMGGAGLNLLLVALVALMIWKP
jgi:uncharacterized membrane protein